MKRPSRNLVLGCVVTMVVGLALGARAQPYVWLRLLNATLSVDGHPVQRAAVYISYDSNLLMWIGEAEREQPYAVRPAERLVGYSDSGYYYRTAPIALCKQPHMIGALFTSAKIDTDPKLVVRPGHVEFTSWDRRRIAASY